MAMAEPGAGDITLPAAAETPADGLWDDWDTPPRAPGIPVLHLEGFDGPMDLLLDLAERQRIDLGRISILELTDQFIASMERLAQHVAIERRADWMVVATRLLLLRSRLLFPVSLAAEVDATREAAREGERLHQMAFMRAAVAWLGRCPQNSASRCSRGRRDRPPGATHEISLACWALMYDDAPSRLRGSRACRSRSWDSILLRSRTRAAPARSSIA